MWRANLQATALLFCRLPATPNTKEILWLRVSTGVSNCLREYGLRALRCSVDPGRRHFDAKGVYTERLPQGIVGSQAAPAGANLAAARGPFRGGESTAAAGY